MLSLSNISIGRKLAAISLVSILMIGTMIGVAHYSNGRAGGASAGAVSQLRTVGKVQDLEFQFSQARIGMRNLQLAETTDELKKALTFLKQKQGSIQTLVTEIEKRLLVAANRDRVTDVGKKVDSYLAGAEARLAPLKQSFIDTPASDVARRQEIEHAMQQLQHSQLDPLVQPTIDRLEEIRHVAEELADKDAHAAVAAMTDGEMMVIAFGAFAALVLIGAAFFGSATIARPLKNMVQPLEKIAGGNFTVDIPGTGRKDEVGQIAGAVHDMAAKMSQTIAEIKASGREVTNASAEI
ncbi:MAG: methyl-accepting chemotaxis protein, partial [Proteobacteria bacterium]|nr:methyl-accepting chemotaxis protein [Pseudomonadota bacterium]